MLLFYQGYRLFQSLPFKNVLLKVQRRFYGDSKSEKSDPKLPSGQPIHASERPSVSAVHSLHPSKRLSNTSGCSSEFEKNLAFKCIRLEDVAIPSGRQSVFDK
jgi:hypothetical protein